MATAQLEEALARLDGLERGSDKERSSLHRELAVLAEADPAVASQVLSGRNLETASERLSYMGLVEALALESRSLLPLLQEELERIRALADDLPRQAAADALSAFEFMEQNDLYNNDALAMHVRGLASDSSRVRRASVRALHGWKVSGPPGLAESLRGLLGDSSWRVRKEAEWLLGDEGQLPPSYRTPILDRLIRIFLS